MRVEIKIDAELQEPYAVLHIPKLTSDTSAVVELLESVGNTSRLLVAKKDNKSYVIEFNQAELIRTEGGSVILYDRAAHSYTLEKSLKDIIQSLGNDFVRISKSAIVNLCRIDHVSPSFNGTMDIVMKNGINEYITRKFLGDFKKRLGL